ncbi:MAG: VOC family protein [Spirochaetes bacterium]|nr:VOC family protein [Spirochaetota bacterium]
MILRIDHVAIAVRDYEKAFSFFSELFGAIPGSYSVDGNLKYRWQLFSLGDLSRFEILNPNGEGSFLDGFLAKKDGGMHHITMQTADIKKAAELLTSRGIPYFGYHEYGKVWKELFIHPRDAFGVLIQIAEFNPDDWLPQSMVMPETKRFMVENSDEGCTVVFAHPGGGRMRIELSREEAKRLAESLMKV